MAQTNAAVKYDIRTHEGAPAHIASLTPMNQLRRSVLSCMLWENEFYEDGQTIAERIAMAARAVPPEKLAALAREARGPMNLRHVPLLLLAVLADTGKGKPAAGRKRDEHGPSLVSDAVYDVVQRADELAELLAVRCKLTGKPLKQSRTHGLWNGLARAFTKFSEHRLSKYDRAKAIKLKDVMRLVRPKPRDAVQAEVWKRLLAGELATPDTWETNLSAGKDKKATFTRLITDGQLGYLALLRNLRNMTQAGVDEHLVRAAILVRKGGAERILPFRYVAAARAAPQFEHELDAAMLAALQQAPKLDGKTVVVIDVSGSMYGTRVSAKSDIDRATAACALGAIAREMCSEPVIYATAGSDSKHKHQTQLVPPRRGMALVDAIHAQCRPLGGGGIFLKQVCDFLAEREGNAERMIVITDEQDCARDSGDSPLAARPIGRRNYLINVASAKYGIGYGPFVHLDGFSEAVLAWIAEYEKLDSMQAG